MSTTGQLKGFGARLSLWLGRIRRLKAPEVLRRYMAHNRTQFRRAPKSSSSPVVLFELNQLRSAHIAYSYLSNVLAEEHKARIVAYFPGLVGGWPRRLAFAIKKLIGFDEIGVYRSFGAEEFIALVPGAALRMKAKAIFDDVLPRLKNKFDVEDLRIDGILIGDLIYDSYLMDFRKPTIELTAPDFHEFLLRCIELFVAWTDYLDNHDIRAINLGHCVYIRAIPLRIAVSRGIPVYQASATHVYRLSKNQLFAYNDFFYFPERFAALPKDVQEAGIVEADRRIGRRFAGETGVDMQYSSKSAYNRKRYAQLLRPSSRCKILIATHCFFDSPHSYGNNIYPDFYEWLNALGEISESTDYDWYIKTHPDYLPGTKEVIEGLIARYPRFSLLPADASHHQIIDEGITLALTAHGTIAFEYADFGVPVINASQNNPHIRYEFNLHAKDIEHYRSLLLNAANLKPVFDKRKIREYYFMRNIFNTNDIFFKDYEKMIDELGGYEGQFGIAVYSLWLREWSPERHAAILNALRAFVKSGDFRLDYTHFGQNLTVGSVTGQAA